MMIRIKKSSKIYICAPGGKASGGPEALHQLFYYMNQLKYNVFMCYYDIITTHPRYMIYEPKLTALEAIEDHEDNVVIVPEIATEILKEYRLLQKCIWWLSLQHYRGFETIPTDQKTRTIATIHELIPSWLWRFRLAIYRRFFPNSYQQKPYVISRKDVNLCGSKFAFEFVQNKFGRAHMFVEPLGLRFLHQEQVSLLEDERSDAILYNPAKPSEIMEKLLKRTDLIFLPLQGYTEREMIALFKRSKLYVDFGFFGGPERLPKETVYNGTMLLVANRNAAQNDFDVAIPSEFKLSDLEDVDNVAEKIKHMLGNYEQNISKFSNFRNKIHQLEENFKHSIKDVFVNAN